MKNYRCVNCGRKAGNWVVGGDLISRTGSFLVQRLLGAVRHSTKCPTRYRTWHFLNNSNTNKDIATKQTHITDTFLFISHTTNVLLFKFLCNIFIGLRVGLITRPEESYQLCCLIKDEEAVAFVGWQRVVLCVVKTFRRNLLHPSSG